MAKRIVRRDVPESIQPIEGIPEFLNRVYLARGIVSRDQLELNLKQLEVPSSLKGLEEAINLLTVALETQQKVIVIGDFDCDGATSTTLAVHALRSMGLAQCGYLVPNRFEYGYGLSPEIVELAAQQKPDLLITVDNGISSIEGVNRAHELGMKVIVTDHHLPGDELPDADAIVNPNQPDCEFMSKNSAGVGVIFYVMSALKTALKTKGWFQQKGISEPPMADYLDLVALGTVADLVPLDRNNRILVDQGLRRIRAGRGRPGINAVLSIAQKTVANVHASDMGFIVGPRLNAAGRLDDMSLGIECLLSEDSMLAHSLAERLDQLNRERKSIEEEMKRDAEALLKNEFNNDSENLTNSNWGVCLYEPHWHQGVIGILASRVKEKLHRPVIVFAPESDDPNETDPILKGSARSIPGFHMRDGLDLLAKRYPHLLSKFGGHAMAAGMTISADNLEAFSHAFDEIVREVLSDEDLEAVLETDGELGEAELSLDSIEMLKHAGPWGQRFPEPSFDGLFRVVQSKVLKEKHLKLVVMPPGSTVMFDAIQFNSEWVKRSLPQKVRLVYRPDINEFRGRKSVQLLLDHIVEASV